MNNLPKLKIVSITKLCLHETVDPKRVLKLKKIIKKAHLFTNPPIVSYIPAMDKYLVLDGANRTTTLKELNFKYILVQLVEYKDSVVDLLTWNHFVSQISLQRVIDLFKGYNKKLNILKVKSSQSAKNLLDTKPGVVYITDGKLHYVINNFKDFKDEIAILNFAVNIYKGKHNFNRILGDNYKILKKEYPKNKVLFVYKKLLQQDIIKVVRAGLYVPSGISRHIIQGRALRVDIPIVWLKGAASLLSSNKKLKKLINSRLSLGQIRYYSEPTFIFND
ncbi:MAG: hypothetical protein WC621_03465 [Patescibacteria group bacterium]